MMGLYTIIFLMDGMIPRSLFLFQLNRQTVGRKKDGQRSLRTWMVQGLNTWMNYEKAENRNCLWW